MYYTVSIYVEKTGPGNFLPYANLGTMGQQKRLPTYERTDDTRLQVDIKYTFFLGVKDSRPSLVWVGERPAGIDPHILAVLLGATCTSHETHNNC